MEPMTWIYLAALAAGSYMQYDANRDAKKKTTAAAEERARRQKIKNEERGEEVMDFTDKSIDQTTRAENLGELQEEKTSQISEMLEASDYDPTFEAEGNISEGSKRVAAETKLATLEKLSKMASLRGKLQGMGDLGIGDRDNRFEMGVNLNPVNTTDKIQTNTDDLLVQLAQIPDSKKMFYGGLLQQIGATGLTAGMASTAPAAGATTTPGAITAADAGAFNLSGANPSFRLGSSNAGNIMTPFTSAPPKPWMMPQKVSYPKIGIT